MPALFTCGLVVTGMTELERVRDLVRRGEFRAALRLIDMLDQDQAFAMEQRSTLYVQAVRAEAGLRHVHAAAKWSDKALEAAERWGTWDDVGVARLHAGLIYRELGDTVRALQWLQLFLTHLDRYPSHAESAGIAYYNLGLVHRMRRETQAALAAYDQAIQHLHNQPRALLCTHHNKAWLLLLEDRLAEAAPHIQAASDLIPEDNPTDQVMNLCLRALRLQRQGNVAASISLCEEILTRQDLPPLATGQAAWIAAENALRVNAWEQAREFAEVAIQHALDAKEPTLMNAVHDVRRRLHALTSLAGQTGSSATGGPA